MRKFGQKALALSLAATLCVGALPFTAVSAAERKYSEQEVTAYLFTQDRKDNLNCLFFEDMPNVPYINVKDYLEILTASPYTVAESGGVYTVTSRSGETMVIDAGKDTVHFDKFETFLPNDPADADGDGPEAPYIKNLHVEYEATPKPVDLDLSKYQIDIAAANGSAYFPLTTLADMFAESYLSAIYLGGSIYFYETTKPAYFDESGVFSLKPREKDLITYTYNELCFMFDCLFGRPPKSELGKSLANHSFDELMTTSELGKNVKPLLLSENMIDFYSGLMLLDIMVDDGGHTMLSEPFNVSLLKDEKNEFTAAVNQLLQDENNEKAAAIAAKIGKIAAMQTETEALKKLRKEALDDLEIVKTWTNEAAEGGEAEVISQLIMSGDTAVYVFNSFADEVIPSFKWSLDYAEEKGAKNFLIDLSCNSGGSSAVLVYMMSIMTGKNAIYMSSSLSGNKFRMTCSVDRNLDGVIDEKDDAVNYNLRFALLTTNKAYSCANYLPCLAQEQQIPIIGETSGGGTCMLYNMSFPSLSSYSVSGIKTMLYENGGNVEDGAKVNLETVTYGSDKKPDYSKLYDFGAVSAFLGEYYSKVTPTKSTEPQAAYYASSKTFTTVVIIIIAACAALAVIIAVVLVLVLRKRKSNKL